MANPSIRLYNNSRQMIALQMRAPGGDFYGGEQQIRLLPGQDVSVPKSYVNDHQILNLKARRMIKILSETE
jgi:hypothetical protein